MTAATLIDVLRGAVAAAPDRAAFIVLDARAEEAERITYEELDARASVVAAELRRRTRRGDHVAILVPPGLEFLVAFFGCLYAGAAAVPVAPALFPGDVARLGGVLSDSGAALVLTTEALHGMTMRLAEMAGPSEVRALASVTPIHLEGLPKDAHEPDEPAPAAPDELAFLQYTSGSVGTPKGVRVTHAQVVANQRAIAEGFGHEDPSAITIASWLPLHHDMGLGTVLQTIWLATSCYLISPLDFLQRPLVWLTAISRHRVTTTGGPNFAYELCTRRITPAQRAGLDLSSWRLAYNGAEPVRAEVLDRFASTFAECGFRPETFYPCYGLAEAVLFVAGGDVGAPARRLCVDRDAVERGEVLLAAEGRTLVSCGRPRGDDRVVIVDPDTGVPTPPGRVGEIWISGPSVAGGYLGRPQETDEVFGGGFLRTGDLGFVHEGELFVTGRRKDMIIVRGKNHYAEDIERTVEGASDAVRPGCITAFAVDEEGGGGDGERLVVVAEIKAAHVDALDGQAVASAIRDAITARHRLMLHDAVLVAPGAGQDGGT